MTPDEAWGNRWDRFSRHPLRWLVVIVVLVLGSWLLVSWLVAGARIVSPQHIRQEYAVTFDDYKALGATARNACLLNDAMKAFPKGSDPYVQRQSQLLATEQNYNRIKGEYDSEMADIFRANKVKPRQLPLVAPSLTEMERQAC